MKDKIIQVLEETGASESRSSKMDIDDFLKYVHLSNSLPNGISRLLVAFNKANIHFS